MRSRHSLSRPLRRRLLRVGLFSVLLATFLALPALAITADRPGLVSTPPPNALPAGEPASAPGETVDMPPPPYVNLQIDLVAEADAVHLGAIRRAIEGRGWKAAFYSTPEFAAAHPQELKDLLAQGHELGVLLDDDLTGLDREAKTAALGQSFGAVGQAAGLAPGHPLHARFRDYTVQYDEITETLAALESLGVSSLTGLIRVSGGFSCRYCGENGRLMYPLPAENAPKVTLIPVASAPGPDLVLPDGSAVQQVVGQATRIPMDDAAVVSGGTAPAPG